MSRLFRLTFNADELQHAILADSAVPDCYDATDVTYSDDFTSATDALDAMDEWRVLYGFSQCGTCRRALLETAKREEQFWLAAA